MLTLEQIRIRDPFILLVESEGAYYLFGTTDDNVWSGPATGFDCYRSTDLHSWSTAIAAFRPTTSFWGTTQFWAPEVFAWQDQYIMFATFSDGTHRGTASLISDTPEGPYTSWSDGPLTPPTWACLDGTLHVDETGEPWIVYCREWLEVTDGEIYAQRLSSDLRTTTGRPQRLFRASQAKWATPPSDTDRDVFVTDGPWLYRDEGQLRMLWSTHSSTGYTLAVAESDTGMITGPWRVLPQPLDTADGGHGMIFTTLAGERKLVLHRPNTYPLERTQLIDFPAPITSLAPIPHMHGSTT